jgi:hypothetical protein
MQHIGIILRTTLSTGACTMRSISGQPELIEKERIRLQINAQVEEFLRRGGAIEVVTGFTRPTMTDAGSASEDQEEITSFSDRAGHCNNYPANFADIYPSVSTYPSPDHQPQGLAGPDSASSASR